MDPSESNQFSQVLTSRLASEVAMSTFASLHSAGHTISNDIMPSPYNQTISAVPVKSRYGMNRISANSLNMGSTVQFLVPGGRDFIGVTYLNMAVAVNNYVNASSKWGYDLIDQVAYSITGSQGMNKVVIPMESLVDFMAASCDSAAKRGLLFGYKEHLTTNRLNKRIIGGASSAATNYYSVCIPLPWSNPNLLAQLPLDTGTFNGVLSVEITFRHGYDVFYNVSAQTPVLPTAFSNLELVYYSSEFERPGFNYGTLQNEFPSLMYRLPIHYIEYREMYVQNLTTGSPTTLSISSIPEGELIGLLVSARPSSWNGVAAGTVKADGRSNVEFNSVILKYSGTNLVDWQTKDEIMFNHNIFYQDGCPLIPVCQNVTYASPSEQIVHSHPLVLPLIPDLAGALSRQEYQTAKSYGGNVLDLTLVVSQGSEVGETQPTGVTYVFTITMIMNALLTANNKIMNLAI